MKTLINTRLKSGANETKIKLQTVSNGFTKRTLVICNGEPPSKKLVQQLARNSDLIVAADGGANVARTLGIRPDFIIGDLDSITPATKRFFSSSTLIRVTRQDNTDLEKALDFVLKQKIKHATIIAATGKRLDHTLGNLSTIWNYTNSIAITFISDGWLAVPVGRKKKIQADIGTTVSLLPFGVCSGITLKGLHYPLNNATMNVGEVGISNVVSGSPFSVEVNKGNMLLLILADHTSVKLLR